MDKINNNINNIVYNADGYINYDWIKSNNVTTIPIVMDIVKIKIKKKDTIKNIVSHKHNSNILYQTFFC
jgi:hypothetical protein